MKKLTFLIMALFVVSIQQPVSAKNVFGQILNAYQKYQEVNMTLWLVGDVGAEKRFGKELQFWLNLTNKHESDPKVVSYVRSIFDRLVPHFKNHGMKYSLHVIRNNTANAFVIPGGHVYVYTGLLNMVSSDDELAAVISHELAHAEKRHSLKNFRASTAAVALLNAAVKNRKDRETWGALVSALTLMKFSRTQEDEADDIGQFRLASAGFNPAAQVSLWEKFLKRFGDQKGLEQYLSSHPPSSQRIQNARNNLAKMNIAEKTVFANTRNLLSAERQNLLGNGSFEKISDGQVPGWQTAEGRAQISTEFAVTGQHSLQLISDERMSVTRVVSDFIPADPSSDFVISGWLRSADGTQNAAIGLELYDAGKRLRDRVWAVRKSSAVPAQPIAFEMRLANTQNLRVFAPNTAFMRIVLQAGLVSRGSVWFDDLRLRNSNTSDPVNLLAAGDFEMRGTGQAPGGVRVISGNMATDYSRVSSGYAALKIVGTGAESSFAFVPLPVGQLKPGQMLAGSFYFNADQPVKGKVVAELVDAAGNALARRLVDLDFAADKDVWAGTSFAFKFELQPEETGRAVALQIRVISAVPVGASLWLDNFVLR